MRRELGKVGNACLGALCVAFSSFCGSKVKGEQTIVLDNEIKTAHAYIIYVHTHKYRKDLSIHLFFHRCCSIHLFLVCVYGR